MRIRQSPYNLFLLTAFVLIVVSFIIDPNKTVDIHLHDTYLVIAQTHFLWLFAFILWILWILYHITHKIFYSKRLTWMHIIITLLPMLFLLLLLDTSNNGRPRNYLDLSSWTTYYSYQQQTMRWLTYSVLVLISAQIIFIINLVLGIAKRIK